MTPVKERPIRAEDLLKLLGDKHSEDVFVSECKTGPSQTGQSCPRLDAWAMKRSWARPHTHGYEIKVSRSDFLGDDKWHGYLPYCSHFWFVVAPGVCDAKEVPDGCGLLIATKNAKRLLTKRKAPRREVQIPESLWRYVLMARAQISKRDMTRYGTPEDRAAYWRDWLEAKQEHREIGWRVSKGLRDLHEAKVTEVEIENLRLRKEQQKLQSVAKVLEQLGVGIHDWNRDERVREAIESKGDRLNKQMRMAIRRLAKDAQTLAATVDGDQSS